jgi:hypothetical protein
MALLPHGVVHAISNQAYGASLARALYTCLFGYPPQVMLDDAKTDEEKDEIYVSYDEHTREYPASVDDVRAALLRVRSTLRDMLSFFWALLLLSPI